LTTVAWDGDRTSTPQPATEPRACRSVGRVWGAGLFGRWLNLPRRPRQVRLTVTGRTLTPPHDRDGCPSTKRIPTMITGYKVKRGRRSRPSDRPLGISPSTSVSIVSMESPGGC
jgi:hypothetical protein